MSSFDSHKITFLPEQSGNNYLNKGFDLKLSKSYQHSRSNDLSRFRTEFRRQFLWGKKENFLVQAPYEKKIFRRKKQKEISFYIESVQTTNRSLVELKNQLLSSKLSIFFRKIQNIISNSHKKQILLSFKSIQFQCEISTTLKSKQKSWNIREYKQQKIYYSVELNFPFLSFKMNSLKSVFFTKFVLLYKQKTTKPYLLTLIFLSNKIVKRTKIIATCEAFLKIKQIN